MTCLEVEHAKRKKWWPFVCNNGSNCYVCECCCSLVYSLRPGLYDKCVSLGLQFDQLNMRYIYITKNIETLVVLLSSCTIFVYIVYII
jgi:hypothetical protein